MIMDSQAFLRLSPGKHEIKKIYINTFGKIGAVILIGYYFLIVRSCYSIRNNIYTIMDKRI